MIYWITFLVYSLGINSSTGIKAVGKRLPRSSMEHAKQDLIYQGLSLWRNLPLEIVSCSSKNINLSNILKISSYGI